MAAKGGRIDCGECTSARSQSNRCIQSKTTWLMFIHPKFVYKQKIFPKFLSFFFSKNTPKYDKLSKISNISIKTILELRTKFGNFGNFGNFGHILDRLRTIHNTCSNLIGSEPLYILPTDRFHVSRPPLTQPLDPLLLLFKFFPCLGSLCSIDNW